MVQLILVFLAILWTGHSGIDGNAEEIANTERQLTTLAAALRNVSSGGDSSVFSQIASYAAEVEEILADASQQKSSRERLALLQNGLSRREVWIEALLKLQADDGFQNVSSDVGTESDDILGISGMLERIKEIQSIHASSSSTGEIDREALLKRLRDLQGEVAAIQAQAALAAPSVDARPLPSAQHEEEQMLGEDEVAQAGRLVQKATRDGLVDMVANFLSKLQHNPAACAQILNWGDKVGATVLHWSVFNASSSHVEILKLFLNAPGVNPQIPDKKGRTACTLACAKDNRNALRELLSFRGGPTCDAAAMGPNGQSCVHLAAERGDTETLELLQQKGQLTNHSVNLPTGPEYDDEVVVTPLWLAVKSGSVSTVRVLIAAGANSKIGVTANTTEIIPTSSLELAREKMLAYREIVEGIRPSQIGNDWEADYGRGAEL